MSYRLTQECIDMTGDGLTPSQWRVLCVLCRFADERTGACFPTTAAIASRARLNPRSVSPALEDLRKSGWVSWSQLAGCKRVFVVSESKIASYQQPPQEVTGEQEPTPPQEVAGDPCRKLQGTPAGSYRGPLQEVAAEENKEETKEKTKREKNPATRARVFVPEEVLSGEIDRQVFDDFLKIRKAKRAPLTATAWAGIKRESDKAGLPLAKAVELMVEHGWQGLKADWSAVQAEAARAQGKPESRQASFFSSQGATQEQYRSPYAEPSPEVKARQKAQQDRAIRWANYQAALRRQKQGLEIPKSMAEWLKPGYVEGTETGDRA